MKKLIFFTIFIICAFSLKAQTDKVDLLQDLEKDKSYNQDVNKTATLKSSSRLFETRDDLTTVILVIPSGSSVTVLGSDSAYFHVAYEEYEGYIFKRHAVLDSMPVVDTQADRPQTTVREEQPVQNEKTNRFSYLEKKYGSNMAARLIAGKVWKGMNAEMVNDSWGTANKINRIISGNIIKEEWIYKNTWLYFENNTLVDWGPVRK